MRSYLVTRVTILEVMAVTGHKGLVWTAGLAVTIGFALPASAATNSLWKPQTLTITVSKTDHAAPMNLAVWPGEKIVIKVLNYSYGFHTFTIPALNVSALILPAKAAGPRVTVVTFLAPKHGVVGWHCVICPSGVHGKHHAMQGKLYAMTA